MIDQKKSPTELRELAISKALSVANECIGMSTLKAAMHCNINGLTPLFNGEAITMIPLYNRVILISEDGIVTRVTLA
jgi:hypothetical protein